MTIAARIGAIFALGISACTLLYGPSDAEFTGGSHDGGSHDGGTASSSSGHVGDEGGVVAPTEAGTDASAAFACPTGATVCDDFEGVNNPFTKTTGSVATVPGGPPGSSHMLECTLSSSETDYPRVQSTLMPSVAAGTVSFWFKPSAIAPDPNDNFRIADAEWGDSCTWQLAWTTSLTVNGLVFDLAFYDDKDACGPSGYQFKALATAAQIYDGNWHHLVAALDARTHNISVIVTLDDGAPVPLALDNVRADVPTTLQLDFGVACVQTNQGCFSWTGKTWEVDIDQVSFTPPSL